MKTKIIFWGLLIIGATVLLSMKTLFPSTEGPHGGKIQSIGKFNIEMKVDYPIFYAYLLTDQNKPISNKGITSEIHFFIFPDSTKTIIHLKPYGGEGFSTETNVSDYNAYQVTFQAFGKQIAATFENENVLVLKK